MKMGMINSLAAAEPVILNHFETDCPRPFLLRDGSFLTPEGRRVLDEPFHLMLALWIRE
jgi:hypothetical protein